MTQTDLIYEWKDYKPERFRTFMALAEINITRDPYGVTVYRPNEEEDDFYYYTMRVDPTTGDIRVEQSRIINDAKPYKIHRNTLYKDEIKMMEDREGYERYNEMQYNKFGTIKVPYNLEKMTMELGIPIQHVLDAYRDDIVKAFSAPELMERYNAYAQRSYCKHMNSWNNYIMIYDWENDVTIKFMSPVSVFNENLERIIRDKKQVLPFKPEYKKNDEGTICVFCEVLNQFETKEEKQRLAEASDKALIGVFNALHDQKVDPFKEYTYEKLKSLPNGHVVYA